jgi:hypothetical protein
VRAIDRWPLFEVRVTWLPDGKALVHASMDMLIMDVTSIQALAREVIERYRDPTVELPDLGVTFRDYVLAELGPPFAAGALREESERYWAPRLDALPGPPELPRLPGLPERQVFNRRSFELDAERWSALKDRAAACGVTPTIVLIAAFAQTLGYWSSEPSFLLNVTVSDRLPIHPEVSDVVGDFTDIELLEVDLAEPRGLAVIAAELQGRLWSDLEHRFFSGLDVLRELARRRRGGTILAPYVFTGMLGQDLGAMHGSTYAISQTPQVLIDNQVFEADGRLVLNWDCVDGVFPEGMLDDMFGACCRYLEAIAAEPGHWDGTSEHDWLAVEQRTLQAGPSNGGG